MRGRIVPVHLNHLHNGYNESVKRITCEFARSIYQVIFSLGKKSPTKVVNLVNAINVALIMFVGSIL